MEETVDQKKLEDQLARGQRGSRSRRAKSWKTDRGGRGGRRGGRDPLAQSFTVDGTGMNLTSVDLFFGKDPVEKLTVEVRPWNWELLLHTS